MMDCAGYGPCEVPGFTPAQKTKYTWFERAQCDAVTPTQVLERLCARIATDEPLYRTPSLTLTLALPLPLTLTLTLSLT